MKPTRFLFVCALITLSACGQPHSAAKTDTSSGQFLADRGGSSAAGATDNPNQGSTVMGVIEKVNGNSIQLNRPMLNQTITVELAPNAKILQQADAQIGEIQKGDQVAVSGKQQGDLYQAEFVQIGSAGALGGGPVTVNLDGGAAHASDQLATSDNNAAPSGLLSGIVEQVDGTKITVKSSDGKITTVQLVEHAHVRKQKQFGPEALEAGKFVIATGAQKDGTFEIAEMEVLPPPVAP